MINRCFYHHRVTENMSPASNGIPTHLRALVRIRYVRVRVCCLDGPLTGAEPMTSPALATHLHTPSPPPPPFSYPPPPVLSSNDAAAAPATTRVTCCLNVSGLVCSCRALDNERSKVEYDRPRPPSTHSFVSYAQLEIHTRLVQR